MTDDELAFWKEAHQVLVLARSRGSGRSDIGDDPCSDCTRAFGQQMMAAGRCNGIPGMNRKGTGRTSTPSKVTFANRVAHFRRVLRDKHLDPEHAWHVG
jgi:hypothetical protein